MEAIFEALLQLVFELIFEIIAEAGGVIEGVASSEFGKFLVQYIPPPALLSGEIITLDIQSYKGGNS